MSFGRLRPPEIPASAVLASAVPTLPVFQKGRSAMPPSPESANPTLPVPAAAPDPRQNSQNSADLPYMTMTVVAILILLGSLWVF